MSRRWRRLVTCCRMLLFRDWLRASDADRAAYLQVKRDLAGRTWRHVQHYADAKTAIVEQVIARATRDWPGLAWPGLAQASWPCAPAQSAVEWARRDA